MKNKLFVSIINWNHLLCYEFISFFLCCRNEEQEFTGEDKQHTHSIVVNDSELRNFTRNNLAQYDRVFIEGYLNYNKSDTEDGGTRVCGNIVAVHIEKILDS